MSWLHYHETAETLAAAAQIAAWRGETRKSQELYRQAAQAEAKALERTGRDKPRTKGITAVSAAALYLKAGEKAAALDLTKKCLATEELTGFARDQLRELQQLIEPKAREPETVANEYINRGIQEGNPLMHIEVQNLLYFSQGWMLAIYGRPMHQHEWRAYRYGPILTGLYDRLRKHKGKPITKPIQKAPEGEFDEAEKAMMAAVYEYRKLGTITMAGVTLSKNGPWQVVWKNEGDRALISNQRIKAYFEDLLRQGEANPQFTEIAGKQFRVVDEPARNVPGNGEQEA